MSGKSATKKSPTAPAANPNDVLKDAFNMITDKLNEVTKAAYTDLLKIIGDLVTENASLKNQLTSAEGNIKSLESQLNSAKGNIKTLESQLKTAQSEVANLKSLNTTLTADVADLNTKLAAATTTGGSGPVLIASTLDAADASVIAATASVTGVNAEFLKNNTHYTRLVLALADADIRTKLSAKSP